MGFQRVQWMDYLPVDDVREIVRLLGDLAVHPTDLPGKRRCLMQGLATLIQAECWYWIHFRDQEKGNPPTMFMFVDGGWENELQRMKVAEGTTSPVMNPINEAAREHKLVHATRAAADSFGVERWLASDLVRQYLQPVNIGDFLNSVYPLGNNTYSSINFLRRIDRPRFSTRDVCVVHVITEEIDWLHRDGTDVPAAEHVNELSTRQRQVLLQILAGDSAKQIARKLSLSVHTVNDHVKNIHRRFGVSTRGELLAQFLAGGLVAGGAA